VAGVPLNPGVLSESRASVWALAGLALAFAHPLTGCGGAEDAGGSDGPANGQSGPFCGDGSIDDGELCDELNLGGTRCVDLDATKPLGELRCRSDCRWDTSDCVAWTDADGDRVRDQRDLAPDDPFVCRDADGDGCDDCSVRGFADPASDGLDPDGDGFCDDDIGLDPDCMNGRNAASDPHREQACIMFDLMNKDRAFFISTESAGASKLRWNEDIWEVAVAHSRDMCQRGYFAHDTPEGQSPSDRARAAGLDYGLGENIAINFNPYQAQFAFMNEPTCRGHRMNILNSRYAEAAVGYHVCSDGRHYSTQNFRGGGGSLSAYCANSANHCQIPPDPPSVAAQFDACSPSFCSVADENHPNFDQIFREYCPELY